MEEGSIINYIFNFKKFHKNGHQRRQKKKLSSFSLQIYKGGGEAMDFDYFYNREAERFNFLKVPEILVDGEEFKGLSAEAVLLYSMLLKRTGMSFKNNWIDKEEYISTLQSKKL